MMMVNAERFSWFSELREDSGFQEATALSERNLEEQYDLELVLRFLVLRNVDLTELSAIDDLNEFLTDKMYEISESDDFDEQEEKEVFCATFAKINASAQGNAFRRYEKGKNRFLGGFLVSAFETVALGIGFNLEKISSVSDSDLLERIKTIWEEPPFQTGAGAGRRASTRLQQTVPLGREHFGQ